MRPGASFTSQNRQWSGRLAVTIYAQPMQRFSSQFDLQGNADTGSLMLRSPLGTTLASLQWNPQTASLSTAGRSRQFANLDALTREATGAELPLASLFAWLDGQTPATPGWTSDLHALPEGRLSAHREQPQPVVDLTILLDR